MKDLRHVLREVSLFAALDEEEIDALLEQACEVRYAPGQVIIKESAEGDSLYVILEGEVQIYKTHRQGGEVVLARCGAGQSFGAEALVPGPGRETNRTSSVRALHEVRLCRIGQHDFQAILKD